jgi:hypothetical protein
MEFIYKALQVKQTTSNKMIVLFAAAATDIKQWAGVPQKKSFGNGEETVGFQREENVKRVKSLGEFCSNDENIIQNPLLCATRKLPLATCHFQPNNNEVGNMQEGALFISIPDYSSFSFVEVLQHVRDYLENRVPCLSSTPLSDALIVKLKSMAVESGHISINCDNEDDEVGIEDDEGVNSDTTDAEAALFEESHILDFWQEIACRIEVINLMESPYNGEEFLGFAKSALITYLQPIVLVDGQHRLKGALKAAEDSLYKPDNQTEIEERILNGESYVSVEADIMKREVRQLPISLLLADAPDEQVFQFVVVNQKATPIGRALLGTIISTSLSNDEMDKVAVRLKDAGIPLEESQAVTYLVRYPGSPFCGLVERGLVGDTKDLLQWGVFASLVGIFRDLSGGKLFGRKNDYAQAWKDRYLSISAIANAYEENGYDNSFSYWRKIDGPWRSVFIAFFTKIRDIFGDVSTQGAHNYWGRPRESNLFNKVSLTILASDFFQYLIETKKTIESVEAISGMVDDWLEGVAKNYFNRDWSLSGIKKDSTGIRNQWAYQWVEYRKNPSQLPQTRTYRNPKGD